ncbi:MAG TPA: NBR1-Ig-like domain-containing protein [Chloroflexota bacterium]
MQITSGMAGAFGNVRGNITADVQAGIASDFQYNIGYGAKMLAQKWASTPPIGDGNPAVLENWYYALWAYNGWGWVNNPNNPRFSRTGTPASDPSTYPYQERVLYLVAHPPRNAAGNPLWQPVAVTLPSRATIGTSPNTFAPKSEHSQPIPALSAEYKSVRTLASTSGSSLPVSVRITNTGTLPWPSSGSAAITLAYHLLTAEGNPYGPLSPFAEGVVAFGQGATALPADVLPGKTVSVRVPVRAPQSAGTYKIVWDLQVGANTWFSQQGVMPLVASFHVATVPQPTPTPRAAPRPTAKPKQEDARYVRDTSVPDNSLLAPRQHFDKGWLLFNDGTSGWTSGWTLHRVSGPSLGVTTVSLPTTPACRSANLVVAMRAPKGPGTYTTIWRVVDPQGQAVGDKLTVVIGVRGSGVGPTPTPAPVPTSTPAALRPTPTPTPVG